MAYSALARLGVVVVAIAVRVGVAHAEAHTSTERVDASELLSTGASPAPGAELVAPVVELVAPVAELVAPTPARAPEPDAIDAVLDDHVRAGRHWRLDTDRGAVHVWVPADYDAATAATVVFVHGYWIDVDEAWASYRLAQQFALSGINAMFIAPEAPAAKRVRLAWPSLDALVRTVAAQLEIAMPTQRLVAVGHSGAYRTLAAWLATPALDTVILLDAVYAEYSFAPWARKSTQHRLVNIVYETGRFSDILHRRLRDTRRVDGLPPDGLPDARILYVKTDVGHWNLVTDGVALPLALRAIGVPSVASAPRNLPLGLPPRELPAVIDWLAYSPLAAPLTALAP